MPLVRESSGLISIVSITRFGFQIVFRGKNGKVLYWGESMLNSAGQSAMMQGSLITWFS